MIGIRLSWQATCLASVLLFYVDSRQASSQPPVDKRVLDRGRATYVEQCSRCHGLKGQGTKWFEHPLQGELTVSELTKLISDTMPEDAPDSCVGEQAIAVAEFIFDHFYSVEARTRHSKNSSQLQRRTVRQYKNAILDLILSLQNSEMPAIVEKGLTARYFGWERERGDRKIADQIDLLVDYPQGAGGVPHFRPDGNYKDLEPVKRENKMGTGFSAYWDGAVVAPVTGQYEFLVKCPNGFQLYVNDMRVPLIDRWVRSDRALEHRGKLYLVGGRRYRFRLHIFSFDDPSASVQQYWKPPGQPMRLIPASAFVRFRPVEMAAISTRFPADDASWGFERGNSVSQEWDRASTDAAIEAATWIATRMWSLAGTRDTSPDRKEKLIGFCRRFVERAFVDTLTAEEERYFVSQHFENDLSLYDQVKRTVLLALKSPRFLFPAVQERGRSHALAERLAYLLWDSLPDARLAGEATSGEIENQEILSKQIDRMVEDPRSRSKLKSFFASWLHLDSFADTTKDKSRFAGFDFDLRTDLRNSLEQQIDQLIWKGSGDYRQLFQTREFFGNARLAEFYELERDSALPSDFYASLNFESEKRVGILTHPYLLSGLAYEKESSPIHRGVFVAQNLLGRRLRQPPDAIEPLSEELSSGLTTRERVELQTNEASCMNCHRIINPLGFSLENYDAVGRYREHDNGQPVDVVATYETKFGDRVKFSEPQELAEFLANDSSAQRNFVRRLFQYYTKRSIESYGVGTLDRLHSRFREHEFDIKQLLVEMTYICIEDIQ